MKIKKLYLDMDGVLADFERGVLELGGMTPTPLNGHRDAGYDDRMWGALQKVDHFYGRLEPMPGAKEMFDRLWARYGDACEILTGIPKPRRNILHAAQDKRDWVRRVLSEDVAVNIVLREEKPGFCLGRDCVLIDDAVRNIRDWEQAGGTGILFEDAESVFVALDELDAR